MTCSSGKVWRDDVRSRSYQTRVPPHGVSTRESRSFGLVSSVNPFPSFVGVDSKLGSRGVRVGETSSEGCGTTEYPSRPPLRDFT